MFQPPATGGKLEELLRTRPAMHTDFHGGYVSWAMADDALRCLDRLAGPEVVSLETGSGMSTIVLALRGGLHTAIAPWDADLEAVRHYCAEHAISLARTQLLCGRSEVVLPATAPTALDLVVIDGRHGFPSPIIDWFYTAERLAVGGHLLVDDVQIRSCGLLCSFLDSDPHWERVQSLSRSAVYRKVAPDIWGGEWNDQPWQLEPV